MRVITLIMKVAAPEDVVPADLIIFATRQIEASGPSQLEVKSAIATVPQRRGPKPKTTDHQKQSILVLADQGWKKASIATALGISRSTVQNTIRDEGSHRGEGR